MMKKHVFVLLSAAMSVAVVFAEEDFAWVDSAIARFGTNYTVLAENAKLGYTKEAPYPKTFRNGKVVFCKDWDWCSGFFQGCLWYLHEATGEAKWRELAEKYTEEQAHIRTSNLHHDLGFMFLPSAGNAYRITGDRKYAGYLYDAARTLCTRWRPRCQAIQVWGNWNGKWADSCSIIVDCMLNLELLEWAGRNPCAGWEGQPQTQAAIATRIFDFGMSPQEAVDAPRWVYGRTWGADSSSLRLESRFGQDVARELARRGHELAPADAYDSAMGHAGAILAGQASGVMQGASDPRSDGLACGW